MAGILDLGNLCVALTLELSRGGIRSTKDSRDAQRDGENFSESSAVSLFLWLRRDQKLVGYRP